MHQPDNGKFRVQEHDFYQRIRNGTYEAKTRIPKSNKKSDEFRAAGNRQFSKKNFEEAMLKYNLAICYAEPDSEALGLGFANRSAIYSELNLFENSLNNIQLAKENNYPAKSKAKLVEREKRCLQELKNCSIEQNHDRKGIEIKLSYPSNQSIPNVIDGIELKSCLQYGKGIYATRDLNVGDIISTEKSLSNALDRDYVHKKCSFCLKKNRMDLIPCKNCTSAMFCSTDCYEKGYEEFHKFECSIIDGLLELAMKPTSMLPLRMLWLAINAFKGDVNNLIQYFEENEMKKISIEELNFHSLSTDEERYKMLFSLQGNADWSDEDRMRDIFSYYMLELMKTDKSIKKYFRNETQMEFLDKILLYHNAIQSINGFITFDVNSKITNDYDEVWNENIWRDNLEESAATINFFSSFFNHSCYPNVDRVHQRDVVAFYVLRPINKGEQLFIHYGASFLGAELDGRRSYYKDKYKFDCVCEACTNKFVTYKEHCWLTANLPNKLAPLISRIIGNSSFADLSHSKQVKEIAKLMKLPQIVADPYTTTDLSDLVRDLMLFASREN